MIDLEGVKEDLEELKFELEEESEEQNKNRHLYFASLYIGQALGNVNYYLNHSMTKQELLDKLESLKEYVDPESVHEQTEENVKRWLKSNGYKDIADKLEEVKKSQKWWVFG